MIPILEANTTSLDTKNTEDAVGKKSKTQTFLFLFY